MKTLLFIIVLLSAFPAGLILAGLTKEELRPGRKWFFALAIITLLISIIGSFSSLKIEEILALCYISLVSMICYWKSYPKIKNKR